MQRSYEGKFATFSDAKYELGTCSANTSKGRRVILYRNASAPRGWWND